MNRRALTTGTLIVLSVMLLAALFVLGRRWSASHAAARQRSLSQSGSSANDQPNAYRSIDPEPSASASTSGPPGGSSSTKISCINNLKMLGLAVMVFAGDHGGRSPMHLLDMTNEMNTPKILFCPADTIHEIAKGNFSTFDPARNLSYEYVGPGTTDKESPEKLVLFRCPIHNAFCLRNGSVLSLSTNAAATAFVERAGKLYYEPHR